MADATMHEGDTAIEITDVGPNRHVTIPLRADGGVTVLMGRNDVGKTEALRAVQALTGKKERLTVRHDAPLGSRGKVSAGGVELTVAASTRRKGAAEFAVLEGRLSIADLVDPGLKSDEAADATRIRALLSICDAPADPRPFHELLGGDDRYHEMVGLIDGRQPDQLSMAMAVKRQIEEKARQHENNTKEMSIRASGLRRQAADVDTSVETDADKLGADLEQAVADLASIREQQRAQLTACRNANAARDSLDRCRENYSGEASSRTRVALDAAEEAKAKADNQVVAIREQLTKAVASAEEARAARDLAENRHEGALEYERAIAGWEATIAAAESVEPVDSGAIEAAQQRVVACRQAIEDATLARAALEMREKAAAAEDMAAAELAVAEQLREAAHSVDDVLTDTIAGLDTGLMVRAGRLVVRSGGREKFFAELSQGARWKIALEIAIATVGEGGLVPIPQEAWEGLDYENRRIVAQTALEHRVNVITAEATKTQESEREGVTAEVYELTS